jgi:hypothetical protein
LIQDGETAMGDTAILLCPAKAGLRRTGEVIRRYGDGARRQGGTPTDILLTYYSDWSTGKWVGPSIVEVNGSQLSGVSPF